MDEQVQDGSDNLEEIFEARLSSIGHMVAILDTWQDPVYVTRIWTMYEQFCAAKLCIPMEIILPPKVSISFYRLVESGNMDKLKRSLAKIDAANARPYVRTRFTSRSGPDNSPALLTGNDIDDVEYARKII